MRYCSPALLYLIISTFSILLASSMNVLPILILIKVAFTLLWAWFLNFLCVKGYKRVSWILVLVPYMIIIMNIFILLTDDLCVEEGFVEGNKLLKKLNKIKKQAKQKAKQAKQKAKQAKQAKQKAKQSTLSNTKQSSTKGIQSQKIPPPPVAPPTPEDETSEMNAEDESDWE